LKKIAALLLTLSIIIGLTAPVVSAEETDPTSQEESSQVESGVMSPMYIPGGGGGIGGG